ncbi:MAG: branched-chain amino acid ABC transporter permease [Burkholderiales bacterium]
MNNKTFIGFALLILLGLVAPYTGAYPIFLMKALCFALFACAFNLLLGFTGLLSFGHAAFFGTAGYAAAYSVKEWGFAPEFGILFAVVWATVLGWLVGSLAIRRQGIYFAMITLALAQMIYFICLQSKFTGAEDGLQGVPRGTLFGFIDLSSDIAMYYLVFAIFMIGFLLIYRTVHSPFGQVLKAIRENEARALSLGYDVDKHKLLAFVISAGLAGMAGATKTLVLGFETLTDVNWPQSGEVVLMTLIGGIGTMFGPVVGAFFVVTLENELADKVGSWVQVIMGAIFVICVLAFRRGIVGELSALFGRKKDVAAD